MHRRTFLTQGLAGTIGSYMLSRRASVQAASDAAKIATIFESNQPEVLHLAEDVFRQCVLDKVKPAEGTLQHRWIQAGTGEAFYGQWIWDAMFVVDLLAILPEHQQTIRDAFQNYWDFQDRWNAKRPRYCARHGRLHD